MRIINKKIVIQELNEYAFEKHVTLDFNNNEENFDLVFPDQKNTIIRKDPELNRFNGASIHNAATMYYGPSKSGKTRFLISAFQGDDFIFLDFDRNYESTIKSIQDHGAQYFNGDDAFNILSQLSNGKGFHRIIIIDSLGAIISRLANWYIKHHNDTEEGALLLENKKNIGISHEATVLFFNLIIEPMTRNYNSISIIHHTTENNLGSKMAGNKGAWTSVFDFTYSMNSNKKIFELEADRLPIAPKILRNKSPKSQLIELLENSNDMLENSETSEMTLVNGWRDLTNIHSVREILKKLKDDGSIILVKIRGSKAVYVDVKKTLTLIKN